MCYKNFEHPHATSVTTTRGCLQLPSLWHSLTCSELVNSRFHQISHLILAGMHQLPASGGGENILSSPSTPQKRISFAMGKQSTYITKSDKSICPFAAMRQYVRSCGSSSNTPLFTFKTGEPLTRHSCLIHLRNILAAAGYQPRAFNIHIFRIGAATSAAQAGIPTPQIKLLGRWCSSAYQCYIRTVKESLRSAASSLAKLGLSLNISTLTTYVIVIHYTTLIQLAL